MKTFLRKIRILKTWRNQKEKIVFNSQILLSTSKTACNRILAHVYKLTLVTITPFNYFMIVESNWTSNQMIRLDPLFQEQTGILISSDDNHFQTLKCCFVWIRENFKSSHCRYVLTQKKKKEEEKVYLTSDQNIWIQKKKYWVHVFRILMLMIRICGG